QKTSDSGIGFWLSLLVLIGAAGGGAGWFAYHRLQRRREDARVMKTVRFMKGAAATDEQLEGVNRMMENRLEADKAAARGFAPLVEKAPEAAAVQTAQPVAEAVQPAVPEAARPAVQAESAPIEKQVESERREPTFAAFPSTPTEPAVRAPHSGFSVASAYVDADQHRAEAQSVQSESRQNVDNKLVMARNYIGLGAKLQAVRVLREVLAEGNDAQKAQARELIARLDPVVPTDKS
ncbi:MAG: FimV/HubP family polar landmark protein, partial [Duodenibacillus sp.]